MPTVPNPSGPVPAVLAIGALTVTLTILGVAPSEVHVITAEFIGLVMGYVAGQATRPPRSGT